jgi:protein TonB
MFEQVFVNPTGRTVRPSAVLASFTGQMAVVALSILIPLAYTDVLPRTDWLESVITMQAPDLSPPPIEPLVQRPKNFVPPQLVGNRLVEPTAFPARPVTIVDPPGVLESLAAVRAGLPDNVLLTQAIPAFGLPAPPPEAPVAPPVVHAPPLRVRVGGVVSAPVPISRPSPVYPPIAVQTRVSGVVNLEAVIGTDGRVRALRLIKGHPLLVAAAMAAVKEWRYTPTLLNGDPIELVMYVDVNFEFGR